MPLTSQNLDKPCTISHVTQALIGESIDFSPAIPVKWWAAVRLTTLWHIWIARNKETIPKKPEAHIATKRKIWYQLRIYLKAGWSRLKSQIKEGTLSLLMRSSTDFERSLDIMMLFLGFRLVKSG